jgi:hypothetical protein
LFFLVKSIERFHCIGATPGIDLGGTIGFVIAGFAICGTGFDICEAGLSICIADLGVCVTGLGVCETGLGICVAGLDGCCGVLGDVDC